MNGFTVCRIDTAIGPVPAYSRRDFYTIYLLTGPRLLHHADQEIELEGTRLVCGNSTGLNTEQTAPPRLTGYACRFTEEFFKQHSSVVLPEQWSLFRGRTPRAFSLRDEQAAYLTGLFQKMLAEQQLPYLYKHELLRSYLQLVIHEVLRLRTPAPKRQFRYYFQQPGKPGELGSGWRSR